MKLPILIEASPNFERSTVVFLGKGDWDIIHDLIDSELCLNFLSQADPILIKSSNTQRVIGPAKIQLVSEKVGTERSISVYAQSCR